jgi:hypothetical protein
MNIPWYNLTSQKCEIDRAQIQESSGFIKRLPLMAGISALQKPTLLHQTILDQIGESKVLSKNEKQELPIWSHIHMPACILANGDNLLLYIL